jgi:CRP-like cAMP-binding protein
MTDIANSPLFRGIPAEKLNLLLDKVSLYSQKYSRGEMIAFEGDECNAIGIILNGEITIQQTLPSGKKTVIDTLKAGGSFGEVIIFSDHKTYPASIEAVESSQITFISKENIIRLCSFSPEFLNNFAGLLSNKILMLNRKVKSLSLQSPRLKTINFILESYQQQHSFLLHFNESRIEMAEKLSIPRPSLSRELIKMKANNWIDFEAGTIKILDLESLEEALNNGSEG